MDRRSNCAQDQENNLDDTGVVTNLRSQCLEGHGEETEHRRQGVLTSRERIDYFRGELKSSCVDNRYFNGPYSRPLATKYSK
jgi:hypothetical protein